MGWFITRVTANDGDGGFQPKNVAVDGQADHSVAHQGGRGGWTSGDSPSESFSEVCGLQD